jgi:hypothetical protein
VTTPALERRLALLAQEWPVDVPRHRPGVFQTRVQIPLSNSHLSEAERLAGWQNVKGRR